MKRFILSTLLFTLFIGLSGCSTHITELDLVNKKKLGQYTEQNKKAYQLIAVFKNSKENDLVLKEIISSMKEIVNSTQKTFEHTNTKYSFDESIQVCRKKVNSMEYGRYRNSIEKEELIKYCFDDIDYKGKDSYYGKTFSAEIKNSILVINGTVGYGSYFRNIQQKVKVIKFNNKTYLMSLLSSKPNLDIVKLINTNLLNLIHDKKMTTIKPPHKVDFNKFSKLM